jgi:Ca2+-binding EF-hand superfamily protein
MQRESVQDRLATLLQETGELERRVEVTRQVLVENRDFEPNLCFNTLTQFHWRDQFDRRDLEEFLRNHKCFPKAEFLDLLFRTLDRNGDGSVDWEEFLDTVMAKECGTPVYYKNRNILSVELEHSLFRVFQVELEGLADLDGLKEQLYLYPTYSAVSLFDSLDRARKGYLDAHDLLNFLSRYSATMTFAKAERVLRRIDQDFDGRINFQEFLEFCRPSAYPSDVYVERASRVLTASISERYSPQRRLASPERRVASPYRPVRSPYREAEIQRRVDERLSRSPVRREERMSRSPVRASPVRASPVRRSPYKASPVKRSPAKATYASHTFNSSMRQKSPVRTPTKNSEFKSSAPLQDNQSESI